MLHSKNFMLFSQDSSKIFAEFLDNSFLAFLTFQKYAQNYAEIIENLEKFGILRLRLLEKIDNFRAWQLFPYAPPVIENK